MTTPAPRPWWSNPHPWWNKKRSGLAVVAGILCAVTAAPLTFGPATYCAQRGWISPPILDTLRHPTRMWVPDPAWPAYEAYVDWWVDLGMRHDAAMRLRRIRNAR